MKLLLAALALWAVAASTHEAAAQAAAAAAAAAGSTLAAAAGGGLLLGAHAGRWAAGPGGPAGHPVSARAPSGPLAAAASRVARSALTLLPLSARGMELELRARADAAGQEVSGSTHPDVGLDALFVPLNASCHPDCTRRGNCNRELGTCECPFGYAGPSCEDALLSACQLGPLEEPFFGIMVPRNCECVRQAAAFFGCSKEADSCTLLSIYLHPITCYTFTGVPASLQWSRMPQLGAAGVRFMKGSMAHGAELAEAEPSEGVVAFDVWSKAALSLPLSECGETRCHGHGACVVPIDAPNRQPLLESAANRRPHCLCYKGYMGHTCGDPLTALCPGECRRRGKCIRGFCHCNPPYWGLDCGRERAWQLAPGATLVPNRARLRIYVYELPTSVAFPVALDDNVHDLDEPSYLTHRKFTEMLLRDSSVRTENPLEANLFFVPASSYSYASNTNAPTNQVVRALAYVAQHFPYFNASGGRDHFIWTTGDRGSCYLPRKLSHLIHVTLFGLHADLHNSSTFVNPQPVLHPGYACYHPKKDVLAAPWYDHMAGSKEAPHLYRQLLDGAGEAPGRDLLFFFAGGIRAGDPTYSGGARQALAEHLKLLLKSSSNSSVGGSGASYSDIRFIEGYTRDYEELYLRSKFCLAPHGYGFGVRLSLAMSHACVPVIIQDHVWQPYESDGILPYAEFSMRLSMADIPHIVPILRALPAARVARMRLAMARYHRAFLWEPALGGRAYDYTTMALEQRLHGLWGSLWGSSHR